MSRKITDLDPDTQELYWLFAEAMARARIPFLVTSTFRSQDEQNRLFEQGRTTQGKVVTWTRNSQHTKRNAFDIAILKNGQPTWNTKLSVNDNDTPDYQEAGTIGEMVGLTAGVFWHTPDPCHFQNDKEDV
jgi:peptidoglycan L-alanyl-D-glutamate endopeptidase CwlK